jgi:hypothetical protein
VSPFARNLVVGVLVGGVTGAVGTWWLAGEPTTKLIVAAMPIPEGAPITVSMLEAREVPTRFMSKRKLGVAHVAGVLGQDAPHDMRAGDFLDPTHFSARPDACLLDAKSLAAQLGLESAWAGDFIDQLGREEAGAAAPGDVPRR